MEEVLDRESPRLTKGTAVAGIQRKAAKYTCGES